jgi:beta-galactosidase
VLVTVVGETFSITFDPGIGRLTSYTVSDRELISASRPDFWRPIVDNERAALGRGLLGGPLATNPWRQAHNNQEIKDFAVNMIGKDTVLIQVAASFPKTGATSQSTYKIYADGIVDVNILTIIPPSIPPNAMHTEPE